MSEKKGLSPLAWVAIGCGSIMVIGAVVFIVLSMLVFNKAKSLAEDMEKDPALTMAKLVDRLNPEVEIVDSNEEDQTVTFRNVKTGETVTLDMEGIQQGRFGWETDEGRVDINADNSGQMTVTDSDGNQKAAWGTNVNIADWVPVYPDGESTGIASYDTDEGTGGNYVVQSDENADTVRDWYIKTLEDEGYTINVNSSMTVNEGTLNTLEAKKGQNSVSMMITFDNATKKTAAQVQYLIAK